MLVEVCVDSVAAAVAAERAGANRIELNSALELDGLTPSMGLIQRTRNQVSLPVICMVRCRSGGFAYSTDEWLTMLDEIQWLHKCGADGFAFGALDESGGIDVNKCQEFVESVLENAPNSQLVFHKAFDETCDWRTAMDQLVEIGFHRIMTSGQSATAESGATVLREMIEYSKGRIELLPAGGIRSSNAKLISERTGCDQLHGSFNCADQHCIDDWTEEIRATIRVCAPNEA
ncbi:MAG: copper homeostasis protein CutC [Planctomycetota bacterium]